MILEKEFQKGLEKALHEGYPRWWKDKQGDNKMKFIREIPLENVTETIINRLDQFGFTLVYKEDSIEVWA